MNPLAAFVTDLVVSLSVSTVLVLMLNRPLRLILRQICPLADSHSFWQVFTSLTLYLLPLIFSVWWLPSTPQVEPVWVLRGSLLASCIGSLIGLLAVGLQLANARAVQAPKATTQGAPA